MCLRDVADQHHPQELLHHRHVAAQLEHVVQLQPGRCHRRRVAAACGSNLKLVT